MSIVSPLWIPFRLIELVVKKEQKVGTWKEDCYADDDIIEFPIHNKMIDHESAIQSQLLLLYSPAASAGCRLQFDCVGDTREQQQHLMAVGFDINCPYHESNVKPECPLLLWFIFDSHFMFNRLDFILPNLRNTWHEMLNWTEEEGREWTLV